MNFVLACPLILAVLLVAVTNEAPETTCVQVCPPGYHKTGECSDPSGGAGKLICGRCGANTFTDISNSSPECERCLSCSSNQDIVKPCTIISNTECDCKTGFYNANRSPSGGDKHCKSCQSPPTDNRTDTPDFHDYVRKCRPCQSPSCQTNPGCLAKFNCTGLQATPPSTTSSTTTAPASRSSTTTNSSNKTNPDVNPLPSNEGHMSWLVWMVVSFTSISGFLLLRRLFGAPENCLYWRTTKPVNEQHSHQDNPSTTLTINAREETPMMSLSQSSSTSEHPAPTSILLDAPKQDEQDWPAIVLYAIIKEVPLRRWKEFLRLLSVTDEQLERVELEAGLILGSMERQYLMLRLWSQRASASLDDVFSALHYMDLSRCAELLEENLENLRRRTDAKQGVTVGRNTGHGFTGAASDT